MTLTHDVIVVGAGLSGLVCAVRLAEAGKRVLVLEARDRVGGRLHSVPFAGTTIDLGGTWMSVGQPRLGALAAELGIETFRQERQGAPLFGLEQRSLFARLSSAFARWRAARRIERLSRHASASSGTTAEHGENGRTIFGAVDRSRADGSLAARSRADGSLVDRSLADRSLADRSLADRSPVDRSLADYLAEHVKHPAARDLVAMHAELVFAVDPASLSLLHYLRTFASTGGFSPKGPDLPGGGREHRFVGGAQSLALALASKLRSACGADAIRLSSRVTSIVAHDSSITVSLLDGPRIDAHRVVLALPPALTRAIEIDLPAAKRALVASSQLGAVVKCFAAYDRPFWCDAGLSGEAFRPRGTVRATVALASPHRTSHRTHDGTPHRTHDGTPHRTHDGTPHRTHDGTPHPTHDGTPHRTHDGTPHRTHDGALDFRAAQESPAAVLVAFVVGPDAIRWHTRAADERRAEIIAALVEQFGERAATPIDYREVDWSIDPWSTGCVASLPPNSDASAAAWRSAHGRIHFAGTEAAEQWAGYMEGAIEAGERAAREIIEAL